METPNKELEKALVGMGLDDPFSFPKLDGAMLQQLSLNSQIKPLFKKNIEIDFNQSEANVYFYETPICPKPTV